MILGAVIIGAVASIAAAVCAALCLWRLAAHSEQETLRAEPVEDEGDTALREGILNLMRYAPMEKQEEEE